MDEQQGRQKVFITGGAGFIGANLVKYLLEREGLTVTVFDNLSTGSKTTLHRAIRDSNRNGNVDFIQGDILNNTELNNFIKGHDVVIHLAAHTKVRESLEEPKENFEVNAVGTFNVLEAARKNEIDKFIFASSNAAVGEQIPPINEKMVPKPISPYGASKLSGESLCSAYYHSYGLKTVSLRFANAYGPYSEHKTSVIAKFLRRAKQGKTLEIYGDGNQTRDFIHAFDLCQAVYLCLTNNKASVGRLTNPWGETFQIATSRETKIIDLATMVKKMGSIHGLSSAEIVFTSKRKGEIRQNYSDTKKARETLAFRPQIGLEDGIRRLFEVD